MNLIISQEKEFKGEEIEKLNEDLNESFCDLILSNNEAYANQEKPEVFYWLIVSECRMLNQNPCLRQQIFDEGIDFLKPWALKTSSDESVTNIFADLQKIMKGVKFS